MLKLLKSVGNVMLFLILKFWKQKLLWQIWDISFMGIISETREDNWS